MSDGETPQHDPQANAELAKLEPAKLEQVTPELTGKQLAQPHEGVGAGKDVEVGEGVRAGKDVEVGKGAWAGKGVWASKGAWAGVAVLCLVVGAIISLLAAHSLARNDASKARATFQQSSAGIASNLKLAIQREEELAVSASTFFTANPKASHAEFATWVKWAQTLHRYPELTNLGLLAVVPAAQLSAFQAQISGHALKAPAAGSAPTASGSAPAAGSAHATGTGLRATSSGAALRPATPTGPPLHIVPPSNHPYYCLAVAELARNPNQTPPQGLDYCASSAALLMARDSGLSSHTPLAAGSTRALAVETPVYRGNVTPRSLSGRRAASVGWLREVLLPGVLLQQALGNHPGYALRLRYRAGSANVAFTNGAPQSGAQSTTSSLHNGWSVKSFAAAPSAGVLTDGDALALLVAGILLSALLGLLIFVLGAPRTTHTPAPKQAGELPPSEDLYDALTGLPNRTLTLDRAERMIARAGRDSGMLAGALFVDIDRLKDVNEKLGQAASDQLLRVVGERLEIVVRAHDTVGRLGGDEFVVLVESAARGVRLDSLAQRMIEALHNPIELDDFGPSFVLTASIGVAFGRYATVEDLLRDAHLALTSAKAAGKDRYTLFNANMRTIIEGRAILEAELNTALAENQFFLLYQPIYDLGTRRVVGLEAQIRWTHPAQGVMAPGDFIGLAEETGLIVPIGRWALEQACTRAAAWNVMGRPIGISVKVSAHQLNRDGFVTDVQRALQQSGIEPSLLTLEIAEGAVMRDLAAAAERMAQIKRLGVRIAIDDFGSNGYSRHSDLQQLPLDSLRVDRNSLAASEDEAYRSWLMEAILTVGREHSLTVIATGIETDEQLGALRAMGATLAQGALIGKPTPVDDVESILDTELQEMGTSVTTTHNQDTSNINYP
jgi:diguanylate cyclase (GGDEF)-like protein